LSIKKEDTDIEVDTMGTELVVKANKDKYDDIYRKGYDKKYPNLDLVRLERWYFKQKPGKLLDFGFGVGVNLLHMLECGYHVEGIEASPEAKRIVEKKIAERPQLKSRVNLTVFDRNADKLPYPDNSFDYVVCLSVLSLLETRERIEWLLQEFNRVLKPGAKMIIDINGPGSDFSKHATLVGDEIYEYRGNTGKEEPRLCYCPQSEDRFSSLLEGLFEVDDVGHVSFKYVGNESFEYLACVRKKG